MAGKTALGHLVDPRTLGHKFLVLPNFAKKQEELDGYMDQWFYFLKVASKSGDLPKFWTTGYLAVFLYLHNVFVFVMRLKNTKTSSRLEIDA